MTLSVSFFGTRGSIPTPGPATVRFGGNTPCLLLETSKGHRLILDAGTGIRSLTRSLDPAGPIDLTILLSHTHWDHIQGLPFFRPLYQPGSIVRVAGPKQAGWSLEAVLRGQMAPSVFPVPLSAIGATLEVTEITGSSVPVSGFEVTSIPVCHPGPTVAFAIREATGGAVVTYMTDNELGADDAAPSRSDLVRFLRDTKVLIHDAMYFEHQLAARRGWGHSSAAEAVSLGVEAGVEHLVLFHHDPDHDDAAVDQLGREAEVARARLGGNLKITIAAEGDVLRY